MRSWAAGTDHRRKSRPSHAARAGKGRAGTCVPSIGPYPTVESGRAAQGQAIGKDRFRFRLPGGFQSVDVELWITSTAWLVNDGRRQASLLHQACGAPTTRSLSAWTLWSAPGCQLLEPSPGAGWLEAHQALDLLLDHLSQKQCIRDRLPVCLAWLGLENDTASLHDIDRQPVRRVDHLPRNAHEVLATDPLVPCSRKRRIRGPGGARYSRRLD